MPTAVCPTREELTRFTLGLTPPPAAEVVEAHLRVCGRCLIALQSADSGDALTDAVQALRDASATIDETAAAVIARMKALPAGTSADLTTDEVGLGPPEA